MTGFSFLGSSSNVALIVPAHFPSQAWDAWMALRVKLDFVSSWVRAAVLRNSKAPVAAESGGKCVELKRSGPRNGGLTRTGLWLTWEAHSCEVHLPISVATEREAVMCSFLLQQRQPPWDTTGGMALSLLGLTALESVLWLCSNFFLCVCVIECELAAGDL